MVEESNTDNKSRRITVMLTMRPDIHDMAVAQAKAERLTFCAFIRKVLTEYMAGGSAGD